MDMYQKRKLRQEKSADNTEQSHKSSSINWYPGHMAKAKRLMLEDMKLIDVVVELVDARVPFSGKNPDIDGMAKGKSRVLLFNKSDMADPAVTARWKSRYEEQGFFVATVNAKNGSGLKAVEDCIMTACREKLERDKKRGIQNRPVRAMVVGIPNVGKSTFINAYAGKAVAKTGNKPGVTKGKQWIRLNKNVELLDTPGILWPKFENEMIGKRLAWIGSINDDILIPTEMASDILNFISIRYPGLIAEHYGIEEGNFETDHHGTELLDRVAVRRGCIRKGGEYDTERAAGIVIDDFRSVKIGKISLELPEDITE